MAGYSDPDLGWYGTGYLQPTGASDGGLLGGGSSGGGGWLGNLFNFSGGRSTTADLYGDLFSKKQLAAIQQRESQAKMAGLLNVLSQAAAPSKFKKDWGQILGQAGGAMLGAEGGDKAAIAALGGQKTAAQIAQLRQEMAANAAYIESVRRAYGKLRGLPGAGGMPPGAPAGPPPGAPTQPPPPPMPGAPPPNPAGQAPAPGGFAFGTGAPRPFALPGAPGGGPAGLPPTPPGPGADPGAGAGMPPIDPASQYAMMGGGLLGAGGGGAQPPFPEEGSSLPPPDTVIPRGGGGLLDPDAIKLAAAFSGGGPSADLDSLNRNAPFRTLANPQGDPIKWTYDTPVIDPNDPAVQGPGSPFGSGPTYESVLGRPPAADPALMQAPRQAAPRGGGLTGSAWELANHNYGGLRRPGVNATPSQGGFQSFATPEDGLQAISRQLDRYASGATTGKPLTTIRDIVSTWAPPSENPTATLIARAAKIVGADPDKPLDLSDPDTKAKLITATIANEQGGRVPVDPNLIAQVANAPPGSIGRYTEGSGGGAGPAGGSGGAPAAPQPGLGDAIPGLGISALDMAEVDALAAAAGKQSPFKSLMDAYYKTPGYLGQAAEAAAAAQQPFELDKIRERARLELQNVFAKDGIRLNAQDQVEEIPGHRALVGKSTQQVEDIKRDAAEKLRDHQEKYSFSDVRVMGPNGPETRPMSNYDKAQLIKKTQEREAQEKAAGIPPGARVGDIIGSPSLSPAEQAGQTRSRELGVTAGWKALEDNHARELAANSRIQLYGQIAQAMEGFRPGATAEARLRGRAFLKDLGIIEGDDVSDGEAIQRAARQIQQMQASATKGSTSDYERSLIAEGAIQMANSPEGMAKALQIAQRLDEYDIKVAAIHRKVAEENNGVPNVLEAQKRISMLGPPISPGERSALERIRAGNIPTGQRTAAPSSGDDLADARRRAADALRQNVPRDVVRKRLRESGFDPDAVLGGQ